MNRYSFLILLFFAGILFSGVCFADETDLIIPIDFTGLEKANIVKGIQVEKLKAGISISVKGLIKELGNPVSFEEFGGYGAGFVYLGTKDIRYLFSVMPNGEDGKLLLDTHDVFSIVLLLDGTDNDEVLTIWESKISKQKTGKETGGEK